MKHTELLREMIAAFENELAQYRAGNRADYCYQQAHDETYGNTDAHSFSRARLCYALCFYKTVPEPEREQIIRALFAEEITANENESFQGISNGLKILTCLLLPYRRPEDDALFARAKQANFDCACGYDPTLYEYPDDPVCYSLEDCADVAADTNMQDYLCRFIDHVKAQEPDADTCRHWQYYAGMTGRAEDKVYFTERIFALTARNAEAELIKRLIAYENYIQYLAESGDAESAYALFTEGMSFLVSANKTALYRTTQSIMEADAAMIPQVWQDIRTNTLQWLAKGTLYPVCFSLAAKCAALAGDSKTVRLLEKAEKKWKDH